LGTNFESLSLSLTRRRPHLLSSKKKRSGTGHLVLALSLLARGYTATDMPALLPLLRKNLLSVPPTTASTITVAALDWALPALRSRDPPGALLVVDRRALRGGAA
jgi:hypothetical protein